MTRTVPTILRALAAAVAIATTVARAHAYGTLRPDMQHEADTTKPVHRIEAAYTTGGILHTNRYLAGDNSESRIMRHASSLELKYAFMPPQGSLQAAVYRGAYQGAGIAVHRFNHMLGNPVSAFIFQGAHIVTPVRRLSLNYEWNLGVTYGWNPYDRLTNPDNHVIGTKMTARIAVALYLCFQATPWLDINAGATAAHYSNGNTSYPNMGLNTLEARVSAACYVGRKLPERHARPLPGFTRHVSYDLVLFGSWRRRGTDLPGDGNLYALPGKYAVFGLNFNPMYNINHWFNAGISLDALYDNSANLEISLDDFSSTGIRQPPARKQMTAGLSARAEFVMPYFTINFGIGKNLIGAKGDFSHAYQILALKVNVVRNTFLHIGYCLDGFSLPNYLMLGVGYRFNNRRKW